MTEGWLAHSPSCLVGRLGTKGHGFLVGCLWRQGRRGEVGAGTSRVNRPGLVGPRVRCPCGACLSPGGAEGYPGQTVQGDGISWGNHGGEGGRR